MKVRNVSRTIFHPWGHAPSTSLGQATLSLVLVLGAVVIFGAMVLAFFAISFLNSSYGYQSAGKALASATSGVNDALLQLNRNNAYSSAGYCVPYAVSCASDAATVTVTQNSPSAGEVTITSDAKVLIAERKIQVIASVNPQTGEVHVVSQGQLSL